MSRMALKAPSSISHFALPYCSQVILAWECPRYGVLSDRDRRIQSWLKVILAGSPIAPENPIPFQALHDLHGDHTQHQYGQLCPIPSCSMSITMINFIAKS